MKVVIIQRILTTYREDVFTRIGSLPEIDVKVISGNCTNADKYPKLKGLDNTDKFNYKKLFTIFFMIKAMKREIPIFWNPGLIIELFKEKPNLIICEGESNFANNISVLFYCLVFKVPFVWWSLGQVKGRKNNIFRRLMSPLTKMFLNRSSAILLYSSYGKRIYVSKYGIESGKIFVMHNSLDTEKVDADIKKYREQVNAEKEKLGLKNKKVMLFVGAITKEKNLDLLLEAFYKVKRNIDCALVIVGDGEYRNALEKLVTENNNDIYFMGERHQDVSIFFLMSDVFVLPGLGGLAINHAMCHGKPVIVTNADGTEEDMVFNGYNGFIIEDLNAEKLYKKIFIILDDEEIAKKMGKNSRKIIDEKINIFNMINTIHNSIQYATKTKNK